ncbi:FtsW/RodA/SpoVE family cell cycle protein [Thiorhodococcus mannitoliphagus]|uniref:FtsW/RodA/SpoVE family cell cycle protein n=1 Tax=Thiorhodococcus mannitoliphagus TaxID=329406 RepID=A0A6P1E088_9GAMM|nr:FtsW/RodA/SpoVE family cell cycle protein [Thiorhodococcus mannitoliphagus]NEX22701.1 FtsW/RodA/SpoVE family cell cycle protein [Thiorhodococcus mannitoliphagus]
MSVKGKAPSRPTTLSEAWALRWPERHLLTICALAISLGFMMVLGSGYAEGQPFKVMDLAPFAIYGACLAVMHITLVAARFHGDQILLSSLAFLAGFGLLAQYRMGTLDLSDPTSASLYLFPGSIALMLAVCLALMRGRYERLKDGLWIWAGLSLLLVAALLALGQRYRGGVYGAGLITPTEFLKVTVVLFLASFVDRNAKPLANWGKGFPRPPLKALLPLGVFWAGLTALLLLQRDLGMFVILSVTLLVMLLVGTQRLGYMVLGGLAATAAGYLMLSLFSHGQRRIQAWLMPFEDPTGNSWQILQGLTGMYSGGLWGEGFGEGNPEYTPIAQSDFIYSVIGEELGFVGCTLIVIFFLIFFSRGLGIADQTRSNFGRLVCIGLTTVLATQTFLNLGGVTKFIPLTGITLPFISHGGSSLVTSFISLGLLLAISEGPAKTQGAGTRKKTATRPESGDTKQKRPASKKKPTAKAKAE